LLGAVREILINLNIGELYSRLEMTASVGDLPNDPNDLK